MRRAAATALAVAATALTTPVWAQADVSHDPAPPGDQATPLALRPAKALALAPEPSHSGAGWKVLVATVIIGGAAVYLRKRLPRRAVRDTGLTIVRRAAVGLRSELLVVSVDGQRLLLGVTPQSIQTLAMLDPLDPQAGAEREETSSAVVPARPPAEAPRDEPRDVDLGRRFAAMLRAVDTKASPKTAEPAPPTAEAPDEVAGQARGLLALRRRG